MFLAEVSGSVTRAFQNREVGRFAQVRIERSGSGSVEMFAFVAAGEEAGPSDPAGRGRNERIFESHAFFGEAIDVWGLYDRVTGAAESVIALIIGIEEQNVRPCGFGFCRGGSLFSGLGFAVRPSQELLWWARPCRPGVPSEHTNLRGER